MHTLSLDKVSRRIDVFFFKDLFIGGEEEIVAWKQSKENGKRGMLGDNCREQFH